MSEIGNILGLGGDGQGQGQNPSEPNLSLNQDEDIGPTLTQIMNRAKALFDKVTADGKEIKATRKQFDHLLEKQDLVTQDDVVQSAGALVKAGMEPGIIAGVLSDMPSDGQALYGWLSDMDKTLRQAEEINQVVTRLARHKLGVASLNVLAGQAAQPKGDEVLQTPASAPVTGPLALSGNEQKVEG